MPGTDVILPRRLKADAADSAIAALVLLVPLFAISAVAEGLPAVLQPLPLVGIPASLLYLAFRDTLGKGTSLGKRWLGLRVMDLRSGTPCDGRRGWARNLLDLIPIVQLVDFVLMCLDRRGQKLMDKILDTQVSERE
jgi:uncharacterized RDD family membrane protein YckC